MRNLRISECQRAEVPDIADIMYVDTEHQLAICASSTQVNFININSFEVERCVHLRSDGDNQSVPVGLQYLSEMQSVCIGLSSGDIVLCSSDSDEVQCVATIADGIDCISWSLDQDLAIVANKQLLFAMTREFELQSETSVNPSQLGEATLISVGWGSKATQFHGSEGKQAALITADKSDATLTRNDDFRTRISWRADGQYFAVSSVDNGRRVVRVWSRDLMLHSTCENVAGLSQNIDWRPSGNYITSTCQQQGIHQVVLYERNGCKYSDFEITSLKHGTGHVSHIKWNSDSTLLALCYDMESTSVVEVWTSRNYHWYLKQQLRLPTAVRCLVWDGESAYTMHILTSAGIYMHYTWAWHTHCSSDIIGVTAKVKDTDCMSLAAVIDGASLLMTPFRHMTVPPPLSAYIVDLPSPATDVIFAAQADRCNDFLVVTSAAELLWFTFNSMSHAPLSTGVNVRYSAGGSDQFSQRCPLPSHVATLNLPHDGAAVSHHWLWTANQTLIYVSCDQQKPGSCTVHEARLDVANKVVNVSHSVPVNNRIVAVACAGHNVALLQATGSVLQYDLNSHTTSQWICPISVCPLTLPRSHMSQFELCIFNSQPTVVALTAFHRFFVSSVEVIANCSSFAVDQDFVLLTTHNHVLRFLSRHLQPKESVAMFASQAVEEANRRVERGSRIVCVVPTLAKVILQMPRGNLELIQPRVLVISELVQLIDELKYGAAFEVMKRHRIDMNLLCDYRPTQFTANIGTLVNQLGSTTNINLFIMELRNESVTATSYSSMLALLRVSVESGQYSSGNKVDTVCDLLASHMQATDMRRFLLSIITCHAHKQQPDLEKALTLIKDVRGYSESEAEDAVKYLLLLTDVHRLYDVALGTYDFDIVLMVAQQSHMDPKEYLPFLEHLQTLELTYRKFSIDKHLKRYESALRHLSKAGGDCFEEVKTFVREHKLYLFALTLFESSSTQFQDLACMYGEELSSGGHHDEAAAMFVRARQWHRALTDFEKALNWRLALTMAHTMAWQDTELASLAHRLAVRLKTSRQMSEAAHLLSDYCHDNEAAITMLVEGNLWTEAMKMISSSARPDLTSTVLTPALRSHYHDVSGQLEAMTTQYNTLSQRLVVCRDLRKKRLAAEDLDGAGDSSDAGSIAGDSVISDVSTSSRQSGKSSRNKRKAERKKWNLKEGSSLEDLAILEQLTSIVRQLLTLAGDIESVLPVMVMNELVSEAQCLHVTLVTLVSVMDKTSATVWNMDDILPHFTPASQLPFISLRRPNPNLTLADLSLLLPPPINTLKQFCSAFGQLFGSK